MHGPCILALFGERFTLVVFYGARVVVCVVGGVFVSNAAMATCAYPCFDAKLTA